MEVKRIHFETIGSTNTWAKEQVTRFEPSALTVITADGQTAGRGRYQRKWHSPAHQNIYTTYCFFINSERQDIGNIPQVLAISAVESLREHSLTPDLKWPNDLLLNGKKMGGILTEAVTCNTSTCLIVGIGLNINMPQELLNAIDQPATSLCVESGRLWEVPRLRNALTNQFLVNLTRFLREGFTPFFSSFQKLLVHEVGDTLRCHVHGKKWTGTFEGLHSDGSLAFKTQKGKVLRLQSGEILS